MVLRKTGLSHKQEWRGNGGELFKKRFELRKGFRPFTGAVVIQEGGYERIALQGFFERK